MKKLIIIVILLITSIKCSDDIDVIVIFQTDMLGRWIVPTTKVTYRATCHITNTDCNYEQIDIEMPLDCSWIDFTVDKIVIPYFLLIVSPTDFTTIKDYKNCDFNSLRYSYLLDRYESYEIIEWWDGAIKVKDYNGDIHVMGIIGSGNSRTLAWDTHQLELKR